MSDSAAPLRLEPLTAPAFAPFGQVIVPALARQVYTINEGTAQRFHDLATIDTAAEGGHTLISLFRAQPRPLPFLVRMLERHPLGSQAFMPLDPSLRYLVVVARAPNVPPQAFLATAGQGVNFARGTWHHPLLALDRVSDFLVIDRGGTGANCDETLLPQYWQLSLC